MSPEQLVPLPRSFYEPSAAIVAPRLLGQILVRRRRRQTLAALIVETEAYLSNDPACHGFRAETPRNRSMYGPPGHAYVYFIYGNHWCVNAVCCPKGCAEAVLIRAVEPVGGLDHMRRHRPVVTNTSLTNGPAKLCEAMDITRAQDAADLCDNGSPLWIANHPDHKSYLLAHGPMITTTRVGITKAAEMPLRFYLSGSQWVSRRAGTS